MKNTLSRLLSLLLVFAMLFALAPAAFAAGVGEADESRQTPGDRAVYDDDGGDNGDGDDEDGDDEDGDEEEEEELVNQSVAKDIIAESARRDGLLKFNEEVSIQIVGAEDGDVTRLTTTIVEAMAQCCRDATGLELSYVSYLLLNANQGTLYDGYNAESDTGAGVAGLQKYYYNDPSSNYQLENIQFVPKTTFTGRAHITYYGYTEGAVPKIYSGSIYIQVAKQVPGISYSTDGEAVRLLANDFASYSLAVTGRTFRYVSFELPDRSQGTLYYNYIDESIYDSIVTAADRYYRSTSPYLDRVFFVPKSDYVGDVLLNFSGVDSAGTTINGQVNIQVTGNGPSHTPRADGAFVYAVRSGRSVSLKSSDFITQCKNRIGEDFGSFSLTSLPAASQGVLYDDSVTSGADHNVAIGQNYSLPESIRFAADKSFTGVVSVPIVITGTKGGYFDAMLRFDVTAGDPGDAPLHYTVEPERRVSLIASDFTDASFDAVGHDIDRIHFDSLPTASMGALYLSGNEPVDANANTYYNKSQLSSISFLASATFADSVQIPFTGYAVGHTTANNRSFKGTITIVSTVSTQLPPIGGEAVTLDYTTSGPAVKLSQRGILDAAAPALPGSPATIVINRPDSDAGRLCLDFVSLSRYTPFEHQKTYPIADISRVSFLPKAGFSGTTRVSYTVRDAKGNSYQGNLTFTVTPPTRSAYFADMTSSTAWAVPAVDFFKYYGTVNGTSRTTFSPASTMRRADFLILLSRAFSLPDAGASSFADVLPDKYYAQAVASAKDAGIVTGRSSDRFNPEGAITREEASLYLYRAMRYAGLRMTTGGADDLASFRDGASVSSGAVEAMGTLVRMGVLQGDNGRLRPERTLTRAETIVMLYRALT